MQRSVSSNNGKRNSEEITNIDSSSGSSSDSEDEDEDDEEDEDEEEEEDEDEEDTRRSNATNRPSKSNQENRFAGQSNKQSQNYSMFTPQIKGVSTDSPNALSLSSTQQDSAKSSQKKSEAKSKKNQNKKVKQSEKKAAEKQTRLQKGGIAEVAKKGLSRNMFPGNPPVFPLGFILAGCAVLVKVASTMSDIWNHFKKFDAKKNPVRFYQFHMYFS
jgi:myosin heavy subunit